MLGLFKWTAVLEVTRGLTGQLLGHRTSTSLAQRPGYTGRQLRTAILLIGGGLSRCHSMVAPGFRSAHGLSPCSIALSSILTQSVPPALRTCIHTAGAWRPQSGLHSYNLQISY